MSIFGKIARPLVVSPFLLDGLDALSTPQEHVTVIRPWADKLTSKGAPHLLDRDLATATRVVGGATAVIAGAYALGRKPRLSALALTALTAPIAALRNPIWQTVDPKVKRDQVKNLLRAGAGIASIMVAASLARK